jgi:hypothetical protein
MNPTAHGQLGTLYLLHFDPPLAHARHYLGWARELQPRLAAHRTGSGSPLIAAVVAAGSQIELARTWEPVDRHFERALKNRHETPRLCPLCVAAGYTNGRGLLTPAPPELAS